MLRGQYKVSLILFFQLMFSYYNNKIFVLIFIISRQNFWYFIRAAYIFNFVDTLLNIICRSKHQQFAIREKANDAVVLHNLNWAIILVLRNIIMNKLNADINFTNLLENCFLRIFDMLLLICNIR